jgi:DNA-directed RNA polymerase specialized sigma24 family protein
LQFAVDIRRRAFHDSPAMLDVLPHPEDFLLAQKCLEGDVRAIRQLQETYTHPIKEYLLHRGAVAHEAEEVTDGLWADCLAERPGNRPRLATYAGNSSLQAWLKAVALNRLVQNKRRSKKGPIIDDNPEEKLKVHPIDDPPHVEAPLLEIMRGAVEIAFRDCDARDFVLVQLAHANGLLGRELAVMFSCSEAKISRDLDCARTSIAEVTLNHVRKKDPWLDLQWEDFLELCKVVSPACFGVE